MEFIAFKPIVFVVISAVILYISRRSLRVVKSHGFYRFFALEAILVLILLNIRLWFTNLFSTVQILSWICFAISLLLLGQGAYLILVAGKPSNQRHDSTLMAFEKTTTIVTSGIYRYIRHPLYGSLLFLAWGTFLKDITLFSASLIIIATTFLVATAKADETECIQFFGSDYENYMKHTKMFVPLLF
jgi:protein-S-isoprenylcysteine O-methyltransferase Ste14